MITREILDFLAGVSNEAFPTTCLNRPRLVLIWHGWGYRKEDSRFASPLFCFYSLRDLPSDLISCPDFHLPV